MTDILSYVSAISGTGWLYIALSIYALGVVLGAARAITVYSSYYDVFRCFAVAAFAVAALVAREHSELELGYLLLGLAGVALAWIVVTTIRDNRNPLAALLALAVKLPTGVFFVLLMFDVLAPHGAERRRTRQRSLLDFLLVGLLIRALIQPKSAEDAVMPGRLGARMPRSPR